MHNIDITGFDFCILSSKICKRQKPNLRLWALLNDKGKCYQMSLCSPPIPLPQLHSLLPEKQHVLQLRLFLWQIWGLGVTPWLRPTPTLVSPFVYDILKNIARFKMSWKVRWIVNTITRPSSQSPLSSWQQMTSHSIKRFHCIDVLNQGCNSIQSNPIQSIKSSCNLSSIGHGHY